MKTKRTGKYPTFEELVELAKSSPIPRQMDKKAFIKNADKIPRNNLPDDIEKLYISNYMESLSKFSTL